MFFPNMDVSNGAPEYSHKNVPSDLISFTPSQTPEKKNIS
jgi:hypothetical protein